MKWVRLKNGSRELRETTGVGRHGYMIHAVVEPARTRGHYWWTTWGYLPTDAAGHTWSLKSALRIAEEHVAKLAELMAAADGVGSCLAGPAPRDVRHATAGGMDDMGERTVDEVTMRWKRLAPGHYQLHIDESTIVAVIERSSVANSWWWRAWDWETEGFGYDRTLRAAKENAIAARSRQKLKVV